MVSRRDAGEPRFKGKVAWIVGASGGLGGAIGEAFLAAGATAVLSGRNVEALRRVAGASRRATVLPLDLGDAGQVDAVAQTLVARHGRIDILVNSTSVSTFGDFLTLRDEDWRQIYEAKLFAYARTMRAALPHMIARRSGAIVNISGSGGKYPAHPSHIAGCSGNAAVNLATKAVADLYFDQGIRANCVAPGPIQSKRLAGLAVADAAVGAAKVARPPGLPGDVADAVLFLASDQARHINGTVLTVDGGATPTVI
ncbi:MAG: SDR family oxidoreductase [Reyranellaceae bacterium]